MGDAVSNLERLKRLLDIHAIRTCREEYYRNLGTLRLALKKALDRVFGDVARRAESASDDESNANITSTVSAWWRDRASTLNLGIACARVGPFMDRDVHTFERLYLRMRRLITRSLIMRRAAVALDYRCWRGGSLSEKPVVADKADSGRLALADGGFAPCTIGHFIGLFNYRNGRVNVLQILHVK